MAIEIKEHKTVDSFLKDYKKISDNKYRKTTNYISIFNATVQKIDKSHTKITVKVNTNYRAPYQYTLYYLNGFEVVDSDNSTAKERHYWVNN